jgi:ribosomal protein S18 acetylase RimI-like enzyme
MIHPGVEITGYDGREYMITQLTPELAETNSAELLAIHNLIPHVSWNTEDLMSNTHSSGAPYKNKWDLSSVAFSDGDVIGFLIAWERGSSETHPFDSIYLHRMAIRPDHQCNGVARQIMRTALIGYAESIPQISAYTLQTNDDVGNKKALDLYESLGFERVMSVHYPDKLDVLMKLPREAVLAGMVTSSDGTDSPS